MRRLKTLVGLLALLAGAAPLAAAAAFDFVPAPQQTLNRIYRIDRATGEVISCQYGLQEGTVGATLCYGSGEGAGPQAAAEYGLVPSRHTNEAGVFRVNYRTGEMSVCYVLEESVVCTPQTGPSQPGPSTAVAPPRPAPAQTATTPPPLGRSGRAQ
ncbi:MAG: FIG00802709: hypothetical protein [uncultured Microvirga sp.]|uniref:Uncharacterized protein n=1 Tax=uncultured Microvirga sp. TaxID=412392 RepID=A0A6J4KJF4_9HYPH|nr:MAG: FIG00802709: hypothetical protein [uncultured Microvirga sp.]